MNKIYRCIGCGKEHLAEEGLYPKDQWVCLNCRKKKIPIMMTCSVCGTEFPIQFVTFTMSKGDKEWRCRKCNDIYRNELYQSKPQEEKDAFVAKQIANTKAYYANMTSKQRAANYENRKKGWKKQHENGKAKAHLEAMKKGRAEWYNNLSEEEKQSQLEKREVGHQKWLNSRTKEEIEANSIMLREELEKFKKSLSEEELKNFYDYVYKRLREGNEKYWEEMTHDKYRDMRLDYAKKLREERESNPDAPLSKLLMPTEVEFKNMLNINKLNYIVQCPSVKLDERFEEKFPVNPVTGTDLVDPTHLWDFLIRTNNGDVFIDIDGSVHKTNPNVVNNDLKRPYQTDGNMAFAIQCLDDNIDGNHIAINITTGEKMLVKDLLLMLQAMNNLKRLDISIKDFKL